jgi:hypothetical protein
LFFLIFKHLKLKNYSAAGAVSSAGASAASSLRARRVRFGAASSTSAAFIVNFVAAAAATSDHTFSSVLDSPDTKLSQRDFAFETTLSFISLDLSTICCFW